jgi:hypothetical protein
MIGARHTAGSTISKGGSSPSDWIILGSPSLGGRGSGRAQSARKAEVYGCALLIIDSPMPSEKARHSLERVSIAEMTPVHCF